MPASCQRPAGLCHPQLQGWCNIKAKSLLLLFQPRSFSCFTVFLMLCDAEIQE